MRATSAGMSKSSSLLAVALLMCSFGCAPPSRQSDGGPGGTDNASNDIPEITVEMINERINYARISDVPEENGAARPINWNFISSEPKEIKVVDKTVAPTHATIILDIKTTSSPRSREQRYLAGQIRTEWELKTGWVLRQWKIVDAENISMKYRDLPKSAAENNGS
jgi:hypothetical protein